MKKASCKKFLQRDDEPLSRQEEIVRVVGERLRGARRSRGWAMRVVAEKVGKSVSLISQVERAEAAPSLPTVAKICGALGVRMSDVFEGF